MNQQSFITGRASMLYPIPPSEKKKAVQYLIDNGSSPILGFLVIYKGLLKTGREKSHTAESYPM